VDLALWHSSADDLMVNGKSVTSSSLATGKWIKQGKQRG